MRVASAINVKFVDKTQCWGVRETCEPLIESEINDSVITKPLNTAELLTCHDGWMIKYSKPVDGSLNRPTGHRPSGPWAKTFVWSDISCRKVSQTTTKWHKMTSKGCETTTWRHKLAEETQSHCRGVYLYIYIYSVGRCFYPKLQYSRRRWSEY